MNEITQKMLVGLVSVIIGSAGTYIVKAISIEGRLDAIEKTMVRNETKLDTILMRTITK